MSVEHVRAMREATSQYRESKRTLSACARRTFGALKAYPQCGQRSAASGTEFVQLSQLAWLKSGEELPSGVVSASVIVASTIQRVGDGGKQRQGPCRELVESDCMDSSDYAF